MLLDNPVNLHGSSTSMRKCKNRSYNFCLVIKMEVDVKCKAHPDQELCQYCETCNVFFCAACLIKHCGHKAFFYKDLIPILKNQIDKDITKLNQEDIRLNELLNKINATFKNASKIASESGVEQEKILKSCLSGIEKLDNEKKLIFSKGIVTLSNFILKINEFRLLCKQKTNRNADSARILENNPNARTVIRIKNIIDAKFDYNYASNLDFERQINKISHAISGVNVDEPSRFVCENILMGTKEKLENSLYSHIKKELAEDYKAKFLEGERKIEILLQKIAQIEKNLAEDKKDVKIAELDEKVKKLETESIAKDKIITGLTQKIGSLEQRIQEKNKEFETSDNAKTEIIKEVKKQIQEIVKDKITNDAKVSEIMQKITSVEQQENNLRLMQTENSSKINNITNSVTKLQLQHSCMQY